MTFVALSLQGDSVTISPIYLSIGPDANTSSSYAAYTANAQTAVANGLSSVGGNIQVTPSAFNLIGSGSTVAVDGSSITNTPFPSWLGVADPTGALSGEQGNMLFWSVVLTGSNGSNISLSQVTFAQSSNDPLNYFGDPANPFTATYSNYAPDSVGITSTGTKITSGASTQQVNEIILTGFAAAQSGYGVPTSGTDAQKLQQIDDAFAAGLGSYSINTCVLLRFRVRQQSKHVRFGECCELAGRKHTRARLACLCGDGSLPAAAAKLASRRRLAQTSVRRSTRK